MNGPWLASPLPPLNAWSDPQMHMQIGTNIFSCFIAYYFDRTFVSFWNCGMLLLLDYCKKFVKSLYKNWYELARKAAEFFSGNTARQSEFLSWQTRRRGRHCYRRYRWACRTSERNQWPKEFERERSKKIRTRKFYKTDTSLRNYNEPKFLRISLWTRRTWIRQLFWRWPPSRRTSSWGLRRRCRTSRLMRTLALRRLWLWCWVAK